MLSRKNRYHILELASTILLRKIQMMMMNRSIVWFSVLVISITRRNDFTICSRFIEYHTFCCELFTAAHQSFILPTAQYGWMFGVHDENKSLYKVEEKKKTNQSLEQIKRREKQIGLSIKFNILFIC